MQYLSSETVLYRSENPNQHQASLEHRYQDLINIFNGCFAKEYNTQLMRGGEEPLYLPRDATRSYHAIYFAHGYFSSALHECAHWLIAGEERRKLVDFGYWYAPDGRSKAQQKLFQQVEVKPQALEWILSKAANYRFHVSLDNLNGENEDIEPFKQAIFRQVQYYCNKGLSSRAEQFRHALCVFYGGSFELNERMFIDEEK